MLGQLYSIRIFTRKLLQMPYTNNRHPLLRLTILPSHPPANPTRGNFAHLVLWLLYLFLTAIEKQYTDKETYIIKKIGSADRAPSLRVLPGICPTNEEKAGEKLI
jgi:hypothetical protein